MAVPGMVGIAQMDLPPDPVERLEMLNKYLLHLQEELGLTQSKIGDAIEELIRATSATTDKHKNVETGSAKGVGGGEASNVLGDIGLEDFKNPAMGKREKTKMLELMKKKKRYMLSGDFGGSRILPGIYLGGEKIFVHSTVTKNLLDYITRCVSILPEEGVTASHLAPDFVRRSRAVDDDDSVDIMPSIEELLPDLHRMVRDVLQNPGSLPGPEFDTALENYVLSQPKKLPLQELIPLVESTFHFEDAKSAGDPRPLPQTEVLFLHCQQGCSRSATLFAAYLIALLGLCSPFKPEATRSVAFVIRAMRICRLQVAPNRGFFLQLVKWSMSLRPLDFRREFQDADTTMATVCKEMASNWKQFAAGELLSADAAMFVQTTGDMFQVTEEHKSSDREAWLGLQERDVQKTSNLKFFESKDMVAKGNHEYPIQPEIVGKDLDRWDSLSSGAQLQKSMKKFVDTRKIESVQLQGDGETTKKARKDRISMGRDDVSISNNSLAFSPSMNQGSPDGVGSHADALPLSSNAVSGTLMEQIGSVIDRRLPQQTVFEFVHKQAKRADDKEAWLLQRKSSEQLTVRRQRSSQETEVETEETNAEFGLKDHIITPAVVKRGKGNNKKEYSVLHVGQKLRDEIVEISEDALYVMRPRMRSRAIAPASGKTYSMRMQRTNSPLKQQRNRGSKRDEEAGCIEPPPAPMKLQRL
ncbi:unnamed protein product [Amoebophrya sp. A120]|nr:unnamed protein product [Amoebophrya sp. A120]|eukprot:GSA120T00001540001.1